MEASKKSEAFLWGFPKNQNICKVIEIERGKIG
jgi:hypothetical protein